MRKTMPDQRIQRTVADMKVGESKYVVPWCIGLDRYNRPWINSNYPIHDEPGGTISVLISRTDDGIVIDLRQYADDYQWDRSYSCGRWHDTPCAGVLV
jgi:hypothetical protein